MTSSAVDAASPSLRTITASIASTRRILLLRLVGHEARQRHWLSQYNPSRPGRERMPMGVTTAQVSGIGIGGLVGPAAQEISGTIKIGNVGFRFILIQSLDWTPPFDRVLAINATASRRFVRDHARSYPDQDRATRILSERGRQTPSDKAVQPIPGPFDGQATA